MAFNYRLELEKYGFGCAAQPMEKHLVVCIDRNPIDK